MTGWDTRDGIEETLVITQEGKQSMADNDTPYQYTTLECYASLAELAASLQAGQCNVEVQAAVLVLAELTLDALKNASVSHLDAVCAECSELVRRLGEAERATADG